MRQIKQGAARTIMLLMVSSSDHVSGVAGATLAVTISKAGGAFASIAPTIVDRGSGWYSMALLAADAGTLGDLAIHATATGCDPSDALLEVVAYDPQSATSLGLANLDAAISTRALENGGRVEDIHLDVGDIHNDVGTIIGTTDSIKTKTDNLPIDPADESLLEAVIATRAAPGAAMTLTAAYDAAKTAMQAGSLVDITAASVDAILDEIVEGALSLRQSMRIMLSVASGKTTIVDLGGGAATVGFKSLDGLKDRVTAAMTGSERTTVTVDGS